MNDDDVMQWLSDEERGAGPAWTTEYDDDEIRRMQRALAETRKALAVFRPRLACDICGICGHTGGHEPGCIFTTMPRPKK